MRLFTFLAGIAVGTLLSKRSTSSGSMQRQPQRGAMQQEPRTLAAGSAERGLGGDNDQPTHLLARTDEQVRDRIRSQVQRTIRNPEAIQVEVQDGCVTLRGLIQAQDIFLIMAEVENTAGVTSVRNELDVQGSLEDVTAPMTRDRPAVRAAERETSRMS
jgi:osmotically-inducible protein OsmY